MPLPLEVVIEVWQGSTTGGRGTRAARRLPRPAAPRPGWWPTAVVGLRALRRGRDGAGWRRRSIHRVSSASGRADRRRWPAARRVQRAGRRRPERCPPADRRARPCRSASGRDPRGRVAARGACRRRPADLAFRSARSNVRRPPRAAAFRATGRIWRESRRAAGASTIGHDLAAVAIDQGYADQAHMTREFRTWFALSPGRFRRRPISWPRCARRAIARACRRRSFSSARRRL